MRVQFKTSYNFDIDHLVDPGERFRVLALVLLALAAPLFVSSFGLSELTMVSVRCGSPGFQLDCLKFQGNKSSMRFWG